MVENPWVQSQVPAPPKEPKESVSILLRVRNLNPENPQSRRGGAFWKEKQRSAVWSWWGATFQRLTVDLGDLPDSVRDGWLVDFKLEGVRVWVKVLVRRSQNDHTEVFGIVTDLGHRGVDEGRVVVHVLEGYQQGPGASGRRVACGRGKALVGTW